jgi:hypothetical protein
LLFGAMAKRGSLPPFHLRFKARKHNALPWTYICRCLSRSSEFYFLLKWFTRYKVYARMPQSRQDTL